METFFIYLIKSSGLLILFFLSYHFMLRKETFFISNRWFLLVGLLTSAFLPLLVFTKTIWIDPTPTEIDWSTIPVTTAVEKDRTEEYLYLTLAIAYCIGMLGLLVKFVFDFYNLSSILKGKSVHKQANFRLIDVKENIAPFSFYTTIVYNSALYSPVEFESILEHEKVHSEQNHTTDVLISRLFCILFWFNPIVWLYKKAILQNLEFIADSVASKKISDKKAYQITLLKITTQENAIAITNHFYQSLIKKRIVMLNKNQSDKRNSWKYASIVPALIAFVFLFQIEVVAQEKVKDEITKVRSEDTSKANDMMLQEKDSLTKIKTILVNTTKNKGIDANTIIFIDGKKVTKEEMDQTDPDDIKTMNVSKANDRATITIITKSNTDDNASIFDDKTPAIELGLEKTDPTNLNGLQKPKANYTSKNATIEKEGIPEDTEVFINGKRVSPVEAENLDPNLISTINVQKEAISNKNSVRIITKSYITGKGNIAEPPTPPKPPTFNFKAPKAPNFPKAPKAPKGDPINGDKKAWKEYDMKMEDFNTKMKAIAPQIEAFDKKMEEFDKQMAPFNAKMEIFEAKIKVYEKQMEDYQSKLNSN